MMNKFEFSKEPDLPGSTFIGHEFYNVYKYAEFLQNGNNINQILNQGYQLRHKLKTVLPGATVVISGMWLSTDLPVIVKKTGLDVTIKHFEFTQNRLTGLVAAYAYDNRKDLPNVQSEEARALGLTWDNSNAMKCKLYLAAVTGAEHFDDQFSYWPLVCSLKKLQLKKINEGLVVKIAKKKTKNGVRLGSLLKANLEEAKTIWSHLPGDSDFAAFINTIAASFDFEK